jgi:hypothetical protein
LPDDSFLFFKIKDKALKLNHHWGNTWLEEEACHEKDDLQEALRNLNEIEYPFSIKVGALEFINILAYMNPINESIRFSVKNGQVRMDCSYNGISCSSVYPLSLKDCENLEKKIITVTSLNHLYSFLKNLKGCIKGIEIFLNTDQPLKFISHTYNYEIKGWIAPRIEEVD